MRRFGVSRLVGDFAMSHATRPAKLSPRHRSRHLALSGPTPPGSNHGPSSDMRVAWTTPPGPDRNRFRSAAPPRATEGACARARAGAALFPEGALRASPSDENRPAARPISASTCPHMAACASGKKPRREGVTSTTWHAHTLRRGRPTLRWRECVENTMRSARTWRESRWRSKERNLIT